MEPRASIGDYNPSSEELTLYTANQNPHLTRLVLSAFLLQFNLNTNLE